VKKFEKTWSTCKNFNFFKVITTVVNSKISKISKSALNKVYYVSSKGFYK